MVELGWAFRLIRLNWLTIIVSRRKRDWCRAKCNEYPLDKLRDLPDGARSTTTK
jgi:hypothetical protein